MKPLKKKVLCIAIPLLILFSCLNIMPLYQTYQFSVSSNSFDMTFVGLANYIAVFNNHYFLLSLKNTLRITILLVFSTSLSVIVIPCFLRPWKNKVLSFSFLVFPMLIPSVSAATIWKSIFDLNAFTSAVTCHIALLSLFIWKYSGICILILCSGLDRIDPEIFDAAVVDGLSNKMLYFRLSLPILRSYLVVIVMILCMYALHIYQESYLLFGLYPNNEMYTIVHYMNNHFLKYQYQNVAVAGIILLIFTLIIIICSICVVRAKRKLVK